MSNVKMNCLKCNQEIEVDLERDHCFCVYCGTKLDVPNKLLNNTITDNQFEILPSNDEGITRPTIDKVGGESIGGQLESKLKIDEKLVPKS